MAELNITLFGGLEIRRATGGLVEIEGKKAKALLAYLASTPGRQRSREQVCALLWGSRGEPQARGSLRQVLTSLRHSLSVLHADPLVTTRDQVWLDTSTMWVDAEEFGRCLQLGTAADLAQAVALYRGTFLDGLEVREAEFESWLAGERYRYQEAVTKACRMLLSHGEGSAEPQRQLEVAQRLVALDACDEEGHRTLMRLYAANGDASLALRQYQICCDTLRDELGISPSPRTERLLNEIRRSRSRAFPRSGQMPHLAGQAGPDVSPAQQLSMKGVSLLDGEAGGSDTQRPSAASAALWVAVLPFANMSDDPAQSYFSDGIAEDIITELSRFRELAVLSRSTSFR